MKFKIQLFLAGVLPCAIAMKTSLFAQRLASSILVTTFFTLFSLFSVTGLAVNETGTFSNCYKNLSENGWISWFQKTFLKKCSIDLGCDQKGPTQMVACLQIQASVDYQLQQDPHLQKLFDQDEDLRKKFVTDPEYRSFLRDIELKKLFEAPSGVSEGYLVGEHTTRALVIFASQEKFFQLSNMPRPSLVKDKLKFMKYVVAYHDIGKSISARIFNDNRKEIAFSYPIAWRLMNIAGFTEAESKLAISLIHLHKHIGGFLQEKMTLSQVVAEFNIYAKFNAVSALDIYRLLEILFVADAGSYPYLQKKIFVTDSEGKMSIKSPRIEELKSSL